MLTSFSCDLPHNGVAPWTHRETVQGDFVGSSTVVGIWDLFMQQTFTY